MSSNQEVKKFGPFDHLQVKNFLPHRFPFLFVDRILSMEVPVSAEGKLLELGTKIVGLKNATINEPYFTGHFPQLPITPGVIMIETMAQVASFAVLPWVKTDDQMRVTSAFDLRLAGIDAARFRRPFVPGDSLQVTVEVIKHRGPIWAFKCIGEVEGQLVVESEILASVNLGGSK
jgi:3-hydroxyacyl-[acyl-carrier-protein] dehydratase